MLLPKSNFSLDQPLCGMLKSKQSIKSAHITAATVYFVVKWTWSLSHLVEGSINENHTPYVHEGDGDNDNHDYSVLSSSTCL